MAKLLLLFVAIAAFFWTSHAQSGVRPALSGAAVCNSAFGSSQYTTMCLCANSGSCTSSAAVWFSCTNNGNDLLNNLGLRFTESTGQGTNGIDFQISNQGDWCGPPATTPDMYSQSVPTGSAAGTNGPSPSDQWQTSGVITLGNGASSSTLPIGRGMMACTKNNLMNANSNGNFGPIAPRCAKNLQGGSPSYVGPSTLTCPSLNLFDGYAATAYVGWGINGVKVRQSSGANTCWNLPSGDPIEVVRSLPDSPQLWSPSASGAAGWNNMAYSGGTITCKASLFNPCQRLCPTNPSWVFLGYPGGGTTKAVGADADGCCPSSSIFYHHLANGQIDTTRPVECCLNGVPSGSPPNEACCPAGSQIVPGNPPTCCPATQYIGGANPSCCAATERVVNGACCPTASVVTSGGTSTCCTAAVGVITTTTPPVCCPANRDITLTPSGTGCCQNICPAATSGPSGCPTTVPAGVDVNDGSWTLMTGGVCCVTAYLSTDSSTCCPIQNGVTTTRDYRQSSTNTGGTKCCPATQVNKLATGNTAALITTCCPTTTDLSQVNAVETGASNSNLLSQCCPTANLISFTGGVGCCAGPSTGTTWTTRRQTVGQTSVVTENRCCPTANIASCSPSVCCVGGAGDSCASATMPCCPTTDLLSANQCCVGRFNGAGFNFPADYTFISENNCCLSAFLTTNPNTNARQCCFNANSNAFTAPPAGTSVIWTTNDPCCISTSISRPLGCKTSAGPGCNAPGATSICCPFATGTAANPFSTVTEARNPTNPYAVNQCCPVAQRTINTVTAALGYATSYPATVGEAYCCPQTTSSYVFTANNPCCLAANVPLSAVGGAPDPSQNCCPGTVPAGGFVTTGTNNCCPAANVPRQGTSGTTVSGGTVTAGAYDYTHCCGFANAITTAESPCCPANSAVQDGAGVWHCCLSGGNPFTGGTWTGSSCCQARYLWSAGGTDYCCPNTNVDMTNGANVECTAAPPVAGPMCIVRNALSNAAPPVPGQCCPSTSLTLNLAGTAFYQDGSGNYLCCPGVSSPRYVSSSTPCCPANNIGSPFGSATGGSQCCPVSLVTGTGSTVLAATGGTFYVNAPRLFDRAPPVPINAACCPDSYLNHVPVSGAVIPVTTTVDSACCAGDDRAYRVARANVENYSPANDYRQYCCPIISLLIDSGNAYCCAGPSSGRSWINGACCLASQVLSTGLPAGVQPFCCPNPANTGSWVWANAGTSAGGNADCCDPNRVLTFSSGGLPVSRNSLAASASPPVTSSDVFCCPSQPSNVVPGQAIPQDAAFPAIDMSNGGGLSYSQAISGGYNSLNCCPASQTKNIYWNNRRLDVCCPPDPAGDVFIFINTTGTNAQGSCCLRSVVRVANPAQPNNYDGATCCPAGQTSALRPNSNSTQCCLAANIVDGVCCPGAAAGYTATPEDQCCPNADFFPIVNGTVPGRCCPTPSNRPAGSSVFIDPQTGLCCTGFHNADGTYTSGTVNGNTACCPTAGAVATIGNPCCYNVIDPATGACCPYERFDNNTRTCCPPNEQSITGAPGTCCPDVFTSALRDRCCSPSSGLVIDTNHNCCPVLDPSSGLCCNVTFIDSLGICCQGNQLPKAARVDFVNGNLTVINNSTCCAQADCAGVCLYVDGVTQQLTPFNTKDPNGMCCPTNIQDCAGYCPLNWATDRNDRTMVNTGTTGDCCPVSKRSCKNGVPNAGKCGGADTNCCENTVIVNCTSCTATAGCGWCAPNGSPVGRCYSGDLFGPTNGATETRSCPYRWAFTPASTIYSQNLGFAQNFDLQYKNVSIVLSPNSPLVVPFIVRTPSDLPIDLYFLQDRTNSMVVYDNNVPQGYPLQYIQDQMPIIDQAVRQISSNYYLGFGTFGDKPVAPFGYWQNGIFDYEFKAEQTLTPNTASVVTAIQSLDVQTFLGGFDVPEAHLDAMLAVALANGANPAGWRSNANAQINRIMVLVTDAPFHQSSYVNGSLVQSTAPNVFDLAYYLNNNPNSPVQPSNSWIPSNGDGSFSSVCGGTNTIRPPLTTFDATREGLCEDYASVDQVIQALIAARITPVFAIAPSKGPLQPTGGQWPLSASFDAWTGFRNQLLAAGGSAGDISALDLTGAGARTDLADKIIAAVRTITQTVAFRNVTSSPYLLTTNVQTGSAPPGNYSNFPVTFAWDGDLSNGTGPFTVDFSAYFGLSGVNIDNATVTIYLGKKTECCYCGDGQLQPECEEECDNDPNFPTDSICCVQCKIKTNRICDDSNLCDVLRCNATGICDNNPITCSQGVSGAAACNYNSCVAGQCVVQCLTSDCCDDGNNCTIDTCNLDSFCEYSLKAECNCGMFNNCFDCFVNNNTQCGFNLDTGSCFGLNITLFQTRPDLFPSTRGIVYDLTGANALCVFIPASGPAIGLIVGVTVAGVVVAAFVILGVVFYKSILQVLGSLASVGGSGAAEGTVALSPLYQAGHEVQNPVWDPSVPGDKNPDEDA